MVMMVTLQTIKEQQHFGLCDQTAIVRRTDGHSPNERKRLRRAHAVSRSFVCHLAPSIVAVCSSSGYYTQDKNFDLPSLLSSKMTPPLTAHAVRQMTGNQQTKNDPDFAPLLQVINVKDVNNGRGDPNTPPRYRLVLSDGSNHVQGMLATQLNGLVFNELNKFNIIRLREFLNNQVNGKNIIIILNLEVVDPGPGHKIGEPTDVYSAGASNNNNAMPCNTGGVAPMYNRTNVAGIATSNTGSGGGTNNPYTSPATKGNNPYSPSSSRSSSAPIVHQGLAAGTSPGTGPRITPIAQLNMYQNRFTIKARVTTKSDIRTWSNAKGEGSLFSIDLLDSSGMDIRATMFKEAVEKFYPYFEVGKVYTVSGGRLKMANPKFNTCKSSFELTLDQNSEVHLVDDTGDIKIQSFDFVKIGDLEQVNENTNVDVIGVVKEIGDVLSLTSKRTGQELLKCDLTLVDDTGVQVRLTMWGTPAQEARNTLGGNKVVAFRRARVSDYGGKSLSGGDIHIEPKIPETEALQEWWSSQGSRGGAIKSLSSTGGYGKVDAFVDRKSIADIKNQNLGYISPEKGDYLSFKAHITFIKKDKEGGAWYTACPNKEEPCRNRCKVTQTTDGNWMCDRCHGTYPECTRKWIFSATVGDDTSSTWVNIFDEQAQQLLGVTADEVFAQYENSDAYDGYFGKANHSEWIFKCRVKNEMVNDGQRLKTQVMRMDPVDYAAECRDMIAALEKF
jgi:replication factor A1